MCSDKAARTADPDGEWVPPAGVEMHWIDPATGQSLGTSISGSNLTARPAWVARYGDKWVEIFPGGKEYERPN